MPVFTNFDVNELAKSDIATTTTTSTSGTSNQLYIDTQLANLNFSPPTRNDGVCYRSQPLRGVRQTCSSGSTEGVKDSRLQLRNFSASEKQRSQALGVESSTSSYHTQRGGIEGRRGSNVYPVSAVRFTF